MRTPFTLVFMCFAVCGIASGVGPVHGWTWGLIAGIAAAPVAALITLWITKYELLLRERNRR